MRHFTAIATLALCGPVATAEAQPTGGEPLIVDIGACVDLESAERQRECYEQRIDEVVQRRTSAPNPVEPEAAAEGAAEGQPEAAVATEPSRASRRAERREERDAERRRRAAAQSAAAAAKAAEAAAEAAAAVDDPAYTAGEIVATVTALQEIEPNAYLISLDNGQIWRQHNEKPYLLRVGSEVRLRPSDWGPSYRLTNLNVGNFITVRRVK